MDAKRLMTMKELRAYTGMGRTRACQWGKAIGACRHFGSRILFDRLIVDAAIDRMTEADDGFKGLNKEG